MTFSAPARVPGTPRKCPRWRSAFTIGRKEPCHWFVTNLKDHIGLHTWTLDTTPLPDVLHVARETGYNAVDLRHIDLVPWKLV